MLKKTAHVLIGLFLVALCSCSTTSSYVKGDASEREPETVFVTFYVKPGKEAEFQLVLSQAWEVFRRENIVLAKPHVIFVDDNDGSKTNFDEIFTWVSHYAPDHAPASVKAVWKKEQSLCEKWNGHDAIEFREVHLLSPTPR